MVWHDYKSLAQQEAHARRQSFRYRVEVDARDRGSQAAFARLRPPPHAPFHVVARILTVAASEISQGSFHCRTYRLTSYVDFSLSFAGYRCHITGQEHQEVTLQFDSSEDLVLPRSGELKQHQVDCHPLGITAALLDFWNPIYLESG